MTKKLIGSAILALLAMGCATPPATHISFNPQTKVFTLDSPKQVDAQEITVQDANGLQVHIVGLKSENDAAVLTVLMQQNIAQGQQLLQLADKVNGLLEKGAAKAATGGIAP